MPVWREVETKKKSVIKAGLKLAYSNFMDCDKWRRLKKKRDLSPLQRGKET